MRRTLNIALVVGISITLLLLLIGGVFLVNRTSYATPSVEEKDTPTPISNPIALENIQPGTNIWQIPQGKTATIQIQAYTSARSVAPGQTITFYVSTQKPDTSYTIEVYRMGWYHNLGGRLMYSTPSLVGKAQGYFDMTTSTLVNCGSCYVDTTTGLVEARWKPSYTLTIPKDWVTGIYLVKCVDANMMQTYTSFNVLGNDTATYVVVTADTTYAAYNNWGGNSLYDYNSKKQAAKVSFDRPSTQNAGSDQVLIFESNPLRWLERMGYNLSYISSVDLHSNPALLLKHKAYISLGHDEYWSKEMRDGVENARDHGVGLAFLEANAAYWQMRFEPNTAGIANRTVVSYKVFSSPDDLERDPLYGKDNARVTAQWRDPVVNRPENALIGIMFADVIHKHNGFSWQIDTNAHSPLLNNTGLVPNKEYGCGLVGYEWDKIFQNNATPANLQIIGNSHPITDDAQTDSSYTTTYIAPSGAIVFATGAVYWTYALDEYRYTPDPHCPGPARSIPEMQKLMANVMDALIIHHPYK